MMRTSLSAVCAVDGGNLCPNTCAREGRCVWAAAETSCGGTPSDRASETLDVAVSEGSAHRHETGDAGTADFDPGPMPAHLRRQKATA